ncbi:hypothetical protein JCM10212_004421 [Sporobolomyces blumeae]
MHFYAHRCTNGTICDTLTTLAHLQAHKIKCVARLHEADKSRHLEKELEKAQNDLKRMEQALFDLTTRFKQTQEQLGRAQAPSQDCMHCRIGRRIHCPDSLARRDVSWPLLFDLAAGDMQATDEAAEATQADGNKTLVDDDELEDPVLLLKRSATLGYDLAIFLDPPGAVTCLICTDVLGDPIDIGCPEQHQFCRQCAEPLLTEHNPYYRPDCPTCRGRCRAWKSAKATKRLIDQLRVKCSESERGCTWQGIKADVADHLAKRCDFALRTCPNQGCEIKAAKSQLGEHDKFCKAQAKKLVRIEKALKNLKNEARRRQKAEKKKQLAQLRNEQDYLIPTGAVPNDKELSEAKLVKEESSDDDSLDSDSSN